MARMSVEERREQLLAAAERVMARDGVAAASVRAIVAEAGVTLSVLHYCFASRDELVGSLIRRLGAQEREAVWTGVRAEGSLREVLDSAAEAYLAHLTANPGQEQMLLELGHYARRTPGMEHLAAEQLAMYLESAGGVIDLVGELTGVTWRLERAELARLVVTITDGVTTTWLADRDTDASRATMRRLLGLVEQLAVAPS